MSTPTLCHTLRLELPVVAEWLGRKISALLQREIHCEATVDDYLCYDTGEDFMTQFERNKTALLEIIQKSEKELGDLK